MNGERGVSSISLEQFVALNDEMAALVRAGIPLDQGLLELGRDMPGGVGQLASRLGARLARGESLTAVLAAERHTYPDVWYAVVQAGLRAGKLSSALEALAVTGRHLIELRRTLALALLYPTIVVLLAWVSFVFLVTCLAPVMSRALEDLTSAPSAMLYPLVWLGRTAPWWAAEIPVLVAVCGGIGWIRNWRRSSTAFRGRNLADRLLPGTASSLRDSRLAAFTEILGLLVRQEVPLPEALDLAASACGDRGLQLAVAPIQERLRGGGTFAADDRALEPLPPLLGWLIGSGNQSAALGQTLQELSEHYRARAARTARWAAVYLPILITALVGGAVTLLQGLALFLPICHMLYELARP